MPAKWLSAQIKAVMAVFSMTLIVSTLWAATSERILHSFSNVANDGEIPYTGLVIDNSGNLYGTTFGGGTYGLGTVFELSPKTDGGWNFNVLHSFNQDGTDGYYPQTRVILDRSGNLYGSTPVGGATGGGTVFELSPAGNGSWTETILYSFDTSFGAYPSALTLDARGNLYGTTAFGGNYGFGTVFELTPATGAGWTQTVLHTFTGQTDGGFPNGVILDSAGNLYGISQTSPTSYGGIFEVKRRAGGGWSEKLIYNFPRPGRNGGTPAGIIFDKSGNIYGTTMAGGGSNCSNEGTLGCGTVFELTQSATGVWTETLLYSFNNTGGDGRYPTAGPVLDAAGNLYGMTSSGGTNDVGSVFMLTPATGGTWTETVLHSFSQNGTDGYIPAGGPILDSAGHVYGATGSGGTGSCGASDGCGTVFEIKP